MPSPAFECHPLTEADLPMLCQWLNRPHLQQTMPSLSGASRIADYGNHHDERKIAT